MRLIYTDYFIYKNIYNVNIWMWKYEYGCKVLQNFVLYTDVEELHYLMKYIFPHVMQVYFNYKSITIKIISS